MATEWRELNDQALAAERAGEHDRALRRWRSALESIHHGHGRPEDALVILDQMARHFKRLADFPEAERAQRRLVELSEKIYGPDTVPTAKALGELAVILRRQGCQEEARPLLVRATNACRELLGDRHPELLYLLREKLDCERQLGLLPEAELTCRESIAVCTRCYGEQHERTLRDLNLLALVCMEQGKFDEADAIFRRLFETWKGPASSAWRDVVKGLNDLALFYIARSQHDKAVRAARRALHILSDKTQGVPTEAIRSHNILGVCEAAAGRLESAREAFESARMVCQKNFGKGDPRLAEIEENITRTFLTPRPVVPSPAPDAPNA